jgi:hypothetical protein
LGKHSAQTAASGRCTLAVDQPGWTAQSMPDTAFPLVEATHIDSRPTPRRDEAEKGAECIPMPTEAGE